MKKRYGFLFVILACAAIYYWWNRTVQLNVPEQLTLYSIDGDSINSRDDQGNHVEQKPNLEYFHKIPVLGKIEITDGKKRQELIEAINRDLNNGGTGAKCFIPRHALRL